MIDPPTPRPGEWTDSFRSAGARPGDVLANRYELQAELGRGGMGRVYRAHDRLLGRDVAVKSLDADIRADRDFARACAREARAAAGLVHPGIVTVHDIGAHAGQSFLVMELVPGPTLRRLLLNGPLSPAWAVDIAAQVADALDYAHRRGVLHCDVKPHNIIIRDEADASEAAAEGESPARPGAPVPGARAKLVDFGIAGAASATGAFPEAMVGTIDYIAPEQVNGEPLDGRTDVYSLGVTLYEMLVGRVPFEGDRPAAVLVRRLIVDPPPPRSLNPAISPELERVVLTALRREPAQRYATAGTFRDALRAVESAAQAGTQVRPLSAARSALHPPGIRSRQVVPHRRGGLDLSGLRDRLAQLRLALGLAGLAVLLGLGLVLAAILDRPIAPAAVETSPPVSAAAPTPASPRVEPTPTDSPAPAAQLPPTGALQPSTPGDSEAAAELPGTGWATFTRVGCEWSDATQSAICFGTRPAGFRVRVLDRTGTRWLIWDPETRGVAYVNRNVIQPD